HRLVKYAAKHGKGNEMTKRLFKAYFTESKLISDHAILIDLALGLDFIDKKLLVFLIHCVTHRSSVMTRTKLGKWEFKAFLFLCLMIRMHYQEHNLLRFLQKLLNKFGQRKSNSHR